MRLRLWLFLVFLFCFGCSQQIPQEAKDAYAALKKLEAKTEVGINLIDYGHTLGDVKYSVKTFLEHPDADRFPDLSAAFKKSMLLYELALDVWKVKIDKAKCISPNDATGLMIIQALDISEKVLPDYIAYNHDCHNIAFKTDNLVPQIWQKSNQENRAIAAIMAGKTRAAFDREEKEKAEAEFKKLMESVDALKKKADEILEKQKAEAADTVKPQAATP